MIVFPFFMFQNTIYDRKLAILPSTLNRIPKNVNSGMLSVFWSTLGLVAIPKVKFCYSIQRKYTENCNPEALLRDVNIFLIVMLDKVMDQLCRFWNGSCLISVVQLSIFVIRSVWVIRFAFWSVRCPRLCRGCDKSLCTQIGRGKIFLLKINMLVCL